MTTALEQLLPLNEAEHRELKSNRTVDVVLAVLLLGLAILLLVVLFFVPLPFCLILVPLTVLGLLLKVFLAIKDILALTRDLKAGQKRVTTAPVSYQKLDVSRGSSSKSSASYRFWIRAGGRKFSVTEEQYYQLKTGDLVEIVSAPHSETIFSVTKKADAEKPSADEKTGSSS